MRSAVVLMGAFLVQAASAASPTTGTPTIRGQKALEPKQLWLIEAEDHRFSGKEEELDQRLMDALAWIKAQRR
jgi:hypothetical protein